MSEKISKRKLESYKRAEKVCQEFRYQIAIACRKDWAAVVPYLINWMNVTSNKLNFKRPDGKEEGE